MFIELTIWCWIANRCALPWVRLFPPIPSIPSLPVVLRAELRPHGLLPSTLASLLLLSLVSSGVCSRVAETMGAASHITRRQNLMATSP